LIKNKRWYHLPVSVNSAPAKPELIKYIAFYFPKCFGSDGYKVIYYADVLKLEIKKRIELFPDESENKRSNEDYFQFYLGEIKKLPRIISSRIEREDIIHIPTNTEKLFNYEEINDLWGENSFLEDKMHKEFKKRGIIAERQWLVPSKIRGENYFLDFALFPNGRKIDIECDGESYHAEPEHKAADAKRDQILKDKGWEILRFPGYQVYNNIEECFKKIEILVNLMIK